MTNSSQTPVVMANETIQSMRDAVLSLDKSGKIILLNPAAEELLNVKADDTVGHVFAEIFLSRTDLEPFNDCILEAIYDPSIPHISEIRVEKEDGDIQHLVVRTNLLASDDGQAEGVVAVVANISQRVRLLEESVEQKRIQHQFGQFFIYLLGIYVIGTLANYMLHTYLSFIDVNGTFFTWAYLIILLVPSLIVIRIMKIPFSTLGMTLNKWKKSIVEGVGVSAILIVLGLGLVALIRLIPSWPYKPMGFDFSISGIFLGVIPYYIHSFIQELLARGVMQSSFERFFDDRKGFKAVVLTSIFGGLLHIHFGLTAVAMIFVTGLFFGTFYLRHHNLIGVTILHGALGIFAFGSGLL